MENVANVCIFHHVVRGAIPETKIANISQVCLIGAHYTAADMAYDVSTISYEILTSLGTRPKRVYEE